jgi:hypothetical protein
MEVSLFGFSRKFYVIDEVFILDFVSDLEMGSGEECQERRPRASVKVDDYIVAISPDPTPMSPEFFESQMLWENDHSIQVRMTLNQFPVGFIDDVGDLSLGEALPESGDGGRC